MIPALVAGGMALAGSLGSSALGARSTRQANIANMQLAQYQNNWQSVENQKAFDYNTQMWHLQNQYNSPTAQMSRLRQAGLNPNLVYGSGVTGNSAGSAPQYQPAKIERAHMEPYRGWNLGLSDAASVFMAARQNKAQIDNMEAQNKLIREQARTEGIRQGNIAMSTARSGFDLNLARELRNVSIDRAIAEKNLTEARSKGEWQSANIKTLQYELDRALFDNRIKLNATQYSSAMESLRKLKQDNDINAFRYRLERITGKRDFATDMLRRLIMSFAPTDTLDPMFNPK